MKIGLLTFYLDNYQPLYDLIKDNRDEYCRRHGYDHITVKGPYHNGNWYYAFQRLQYILDLFTKDEPHYDFIWVLNIQSVITNLNRPLSDYLFFDKEHDFFISYDINGLNAGSCVIRNTDWSKRWLKFIIDKEPEYKSKTWFEQQVIIDNWQNIEWKDKINIWPPNLINSYRYSLYKWPDTTPGNWRLGDLVLSLPGTNLQERINLVTEILKIVIT